MPVEEIEERIRVIRMAARGVKLERLELAATAVRTRQRLGMTYRARYNDRTSERVVSPQRLVFYRGNLRKMRQFYRMFEVRDALCLESRGTRRGENRDALRLDSGREQIRHTTSGATRTCSNSST